MKILSHEEMPASLEAQAQLLQLSTGWGILGFDELRKARKMGYPAPDYCALYAVEGRELLSKVEVIHINYKTPRGSQLVCGIAGVLTRRDKSRLGLARKLLEEVHTREKGLGIKYSLLWTARNNKAHLLYSSLGYVDVFGPPIALKKTTVEGRRKSRNGFSLRTASADDAFLMQKLHSKLLNGRLGFVERYDNFWQVRFRFGFDRPDSYQIVLENGKPIAYARFKDNDSWVNSFEILVDKDKAEDIVASLEALANGRWLALGNTFVSDWRTMLQIRRYAFSEYSYTTLMALDLDMKRSESELVHALGTDDKRFACQTGDHF